ncbi:MAG: hypothetical protein ACTHQ3_01330 [Motilibacteraceae bacterium]
MVQNMSMSTDTRGQWVKRALGTVLAGPRPALPQPPSPACGYTSLAVVPPGKGQHMQQLAGPSPEEEKRWKRQWWTWRGLQIAAVLGVLCLRASLAPPRGPAWPIALYIVAFAACALLGETLVHEGCHALVGWGKGPKIRPRWRKLSAVTSLADAVSLTRHRRFLRAPIPVGWLLLAVGLAMVFWTASTKAMLVGVAITASGAGVLSTTVNDRLTRAELDLIAALARPSTAGQIGIRDDGTGASWCLCPDWRHV